MKILQQHDAGKAGQHDGTPVEVPTDRKVTPLPLPVTPSPERKPGGDTPPANDER